MNASSEAAGALVAAALAYAGRGWPVLPVWWPLPSGACACLAPDCAAPAKHPVGMLVRHGQRDASIAAETIVRWWRRFPHANVAIATGAASGVVVLDVDARHDGTRHLEQLERAYLPLPRTVESVTGGGGRHLYFAHRDGPVPTAAGLLPGIDVRGDGGYVVAPPSRHVSGNAYRWQPGRDPAALAPAALPAWLADVARHRAEPAGALRGRRALAPATPDDQQAFRELMARAGVRPGGREQEMHRCPWHEDVHPSLSVHWTAAVFHCFGCEVGGGIGTLRRLVDGETWPW